MSFLRDRPLALKLWLIFAVVIALGTLISYVLVDRAMTREFVSFSGRRQMEEAQTLASLLAEYYAQRGSWEGLESLLQRERPGRGKGPPWGDPWQSFFLVDAQGHVLIGEGEIPRAVVESTGVPVIVNNTRVAWVVPATGVHRFSVLEEEFLSSVRHALGLASLIAAGAALVLGGLFLRGVLAPVRHLQEAAQCVAQGDFRHRVPVTTRDELGQLAESFNMMAERLEKSERLRRQMIADIAHELRTPLTVIQGDLQAILDGVYKPTPQVIASIHEESLLLTRLVSDLRELSLAEAGELRLEKSVTDLREIVRHAVTVIDPALRAKNIALTLELPQHPVSVEIDAQRIEQVLLNLLTNAERYTPEGGQIRVVLSMRDSNAIVHVSDTGPGIKPEDLPYVFERFWRTDKSRSRATGGSGLGLAIAKYFVEAHGGRIWAESVQGQGATFAFALPLPLSAGQLAP